MPEQNKRPAGAESAGQGQGLGSGSSPIVPQGAEYDLGQAALRYAKHGWSVHPLHSPVDGKCSCGNVACGSPAKHPRWHKDDLPHGLLNATVDIHTINRWWKRWPQANIGIVTGKVSGLVVVDLDVKHDGPGAWADLEAIHGRVDTLTTITGSGGQHWVFQAPADHPLGNSESEIAPGIDTRGEGGYFVAPPSLHISGQRYELDYKIKPAPVPEWLLKVWPPPASEQTRTVPNDPQRLRRDHAQLRQPIPEGQRDAALTELTGLLHRLMEDKELLRDIVHAHNRYRCIPPLSDQQVDKILDSILKRDGVGHFRSVWPAELQVIP